MDILDNMSNILNIISILLIIFIAVGIVVRIFRYKFSIVKEVPATVIDKQIYEKRTYFISQSPFNEINYVITFLCGDKKLYFNVSEFSYNCYEKNKAGILKYKGSKIIDFSEK